ncbi:MULTISPECIES: LptF/LptG family permease [unclassified Mucilaginibacter]|uniref:LptF/LptG family permease n=1 Tax=unclassified Mucilaginibacter TaxID=2617802 RepID=UPI0008C540F8|nr:MULTISPECIES: LptF/LptG family permease [unclassified Mucilaginibacter]WDF77282.1 LptF/LptG family permease [Mucilaginibacter sp. KACC 22773]SEO36493.1 lipopolysaccharide export system permease protein [Mucilaginibacter sp. OK283]
MKKIHLLLLKSFIRPFVSTLFIVMFVLLMLFLFKYIDDLIGKGFAWYIILELMMYNSATNVAMALPLSVLLSTIMTYGALGENYELVAIKAAGISLRRAMYPMIIVVSVLSIAAFFFSDYMLPIANLKYYSLLYDARKQKSADLLPEMIFSSSFPGYTIRVTKKDPDGQRLYGIIIYKKNEETNNTEVTMAHEGTMFRTMGDKFLVLKLKDGVNYVESKSDGANYDLRQRFTRFRFKEMEQKFPLDAFKISRTDENEFKSASQMMNLRQLKFFVDSSQKATDAAVMLNYKLITPYIKYFNLPAKSKVKYIAADKDVLKSMKIADQQMALSSAASEVRSVKDFLKNRADKYNNDASTIRRYDSEVQKKYTLSAACIALFLIGAPLGAIIRKGGLGLPVVISVIFFLIYYIISTIGEKSVKAGNVNTVFGMWVAIIVLTPIGLFLSYKAATDSVIFDMEAYKRYFNKIFKRKDA